MLRLNRNVLIRPTLPGVLLGLGAFMLTACGGESIPAPVAPQQTSPAKPITVTTPEKSPEPALQYAFSASATDPTEGQATQRAARRLLVALLDDQSLMIEDPFSNQLTSVVHQSGSDPREVSSNSDGITVLVGLHKEQLSSAFDRLAAALDPETASTTILLPPWPSQLSQAIYGARSAHLLATLCERRKTLLPQSVCEIADIKEADRELRAVAKTIVLRPFYAEGTPVRGGLRLRPLRISAELSDRTNISPLNQVPLFIEGAGLQAPIHATTDHEGQLKLNWPEGLELATTVKVSLDKVKMFGPLAEDLPETAVQLSFREVGLARTAIVAAPTSPSISGATPTLLGELRGLLTHVVSLPKADEQRLFKTNLSTMSKVSPGIADRLKGELDMIILFSANSEFASRMGTHRVWYEARGTLKVVNAWTGELITEVTAQVTESGVGEPRAEAAAQQTLGRELGKKLKAQIETSGAAVASAP